MPTKNFLLLLLPILLLASCVAAPGTPVYYQPVYYGPGIGLGTIVAVVVSWSRNKSILLAILCGILGWIYVIYAIIVPKR
jgi:peptidoglycan/LPS O-acetylase OafA/YrhL